ncbi:hypothetical protein DGWBC_0537 [Dehalogenimonas sp. WBC-2]|nr:hypothetical protein DGWBC_0537 [Dehalogenimonas sp. WBC-2]
MKRHWKIAAVVLTMVALSVGFGTVAFAADEPAVQGTCGRIGFGGGFGGNSAVITDLLGLTQGELCDLRVDGLTLAEIAATKGITEEALVAAIVESRQATLQAAVVAGRITQEQANLIIQTMKDNIQLRITSNIGPRDFGGCLGIAGDGIQTAQAGLRIGNGGMGMHR